MQTESSSNVFSPLMTGDRVHQWHDASDTKLIPRYHPVAIHITRDDINLNPKGPYIIHPEEIQIAQYVKSDSSDEYKWEIMPPYPKGVNSRVSTGKYINEGAYVSHWAETVEGEVDDYTHRLDIKGDYRDLVVSIDNNHRTELRMAMILSRLYIGQAGDAIEDKNSTEYKNYEDMCQILDDIINCFDRDIVILDGEEKDLCKMKLIPEDLYDHMHSAYTIMKVHDTDFTSRKDEGEDTHSDI